MGLLNILCAAKDAIVEGVPQLAKASDLRDQGANAESGKFGTSVHATAKCGCRE